MKQKKRHPLDLIMLLVFFIGILSLAYPFVSDTLNDCCCKYGRGVSCV